MFPTVSGVEDNIGVFIVSVCSSPLPVSVKFSFELIKWQVVTFMRLIECLSFQLDFFDLS